MAAGVFTLVAAFWLAATPLRAKAGAAAPAAMPDLDPTRSALLGIVLGTLTVVCLALAALYGPRFVRSVRDALRASPTKPERPRQALVAHFLFALFLAYFLEAGIGGTLRPPPSLVVQGASYRLPPGEVLFCSSAPDQIALRKTEKGWRPDEPISSLERVVVPGLPQEVVLEWGTGTAELRSSAGAEVIVDGLRHVLREGSPLELRPGANIIIGELRATLTGPTWRLLVGLTAVAKAVSLLAVVVFVLAVGGREFMGELGWTREGWRAELKRGALALLAFLPVYVALNLLTQLLARTLEVPIESHPMIQAVITDGATLLPLVAVGAVLLAPIQEELLFRGFFQQSTQQVLGPLPALVITSLAFGLIHIGFANLLPLSGVGLLFGALRLSSPTGSLLGSTVAHALFNGLMLTVLVAATI